MPASADPVRCSAVKAYNRNVKENRGTTSWTLGLMVAILLFTSALVWHDLGTREVLGRDENATITKLDQPDLRAVVVATSMKVTGQPGNMQPLYFVLQSLFWPLVGRSAFVLRFLPSVFGLLTVLFTFKLGEALLDARAGLVAAFLTPLLLVYVRYAQIARPYTLLALLSLASAYFLVRALRDARPLYWVAFVLTAALNFYNHYNALFVLSSEGLYAGVVWLVTLNRVRRKQVPLRRLRAPILGFAALALLCAPGFIRLVGLPWVGSGDGEAEAGVMVELAIPFFRHWIYESGLTTGWLQGLTLVLMSLGLAAALYRRRWQAVVLAVLWVALPFVVLSLMTQPRPFVERYVIFAPAMILLFVGEGLVATGQVLGRWVRSSATRRLAPAITVVLSIGFALLFVKPLQTYYATNRAEDRLDLTVRVVERHARRGDVVVVSPRFLVRPLAADGADVLYLTDHLSPAQLDDLATRYERMWILYTSYLPPDELQEPLDRWIQSHEDEFDRVPIKSINALAFRGLVHADAQTGLADRIGVLEDLAEHSTGKYEAWQRYGQVAEAYESLSQVYDRLGEATLAAESLRQAEKAREAGPPP
jgi:hypothetical protein